VVAISICQWGCYLSLNGGIVVGGVVVVGFGKDAFVFEVVLVGWLLRELVLDHLWTVCMLAAASCARARFGGLTCR
jgi:hypothetical protein